VLVTQQSTSLSSGGAPIQLLTDPKGLRLYVGLSQGQNGLEVGGAEVYSINPSSGALSFNGLADTSAGRGHSNAMDPQGRFFFAGWGQNIGFIDSCMISPVAGTARRPSSTVNLGPNPGILPGAMFVDNSGRFLYVAQVTGDNVVAYSIDQVTGALTQVQGPFTNISFSLGTSVADPLGPYLYSLSPFGSVGIHVYQIDQQSGNLTAISGSPFNGGMSGIGGASGIAISGNPVQALSGPAATIFPSTANFGSVTVGTRGPTRVFSIVNSGDQALAINSISIIGTNASSFSQTNTCTATLAPNANFCQYRFFAHQRWPIVGHASGCRQRSWQPANSCPERHRPRRRSRRHPFSDCTLFPDHYTGNNRRPTNVDHHQLGECASPHFLRGWRRP